MQKGTASPSCCSSGLVSPLPAYPSGPGVAFSFAHPCPLQYIARVRPSPPTDILRAEIPVVNVVIMTTVSNRCRHAQQMIHCHRGCHPPRSCQTVAHRTSMPSISFIQQYFDLRASSQTQKLSSPCASAPPTLPREDGVSPEGFLAGQ